MVQGFHAAARRPQREMRSAFFFAIAASPRETGSPSSVRDLHLPGTGLHSLSGDSGQRSSKSAL
jgi:hypothetical protein